MAATLVVAGASAALAAAGPDALVPFRDAAGAATDVGVAFVVDFGSSSKPVVGCVKVPTSDNGYQALAAFTTQEGEAGPTFNGSNLLCSIDAIPASGCGQQVSGGYDYWSYWYMTNGSGAWSYANRGASVSVGAAVGGEDVEGWRYQNPGRANPSDPPPPVAPDYAAICGSPVTPSSTTTQAPATTTPPSPGVTVTSVAPSQAPFTSGGSSSAPPGSGSRPVGSSSGSAGPDARGTATSSTSPGAGPNPGGGGSPASARSGGRPAPDGAATGQHAEALGATGGVATGHRGAGPLPLLVAAGVIAALVAAAVVRWRRRPGTP
jgi:hypothetical protein